MRNLVIASVGDNSEHRSWLMCEKRNFDLWLVYFGDGHNDYSKDGERYLERKGGKWHNIHTLTEDANLEEYDFIFTPDDDLRLTGDSINTLFGRAGEYQLHLAQPGFTWESLARWKITVLRPFMTLRWTNFVENGAALFSRHAFDVCRPTFTESVSGFGLDLKWPLLLGYPRRKIAIVDDVPCGHPGNHSSLDTLMPREEQQREGERVLKNLQLEPVTEYGFELNRNGLEMVASGKTPEEVRQLSEQYLQNCQRGGSVY